MTRFDSGWRLSRIWLLLTLTLSSALSAGCFVPQQRMHPVQRRKQPIHHSMSILYMVSSDRSRISSVTSNTTSSSSSNNSNRRVGAPPKKKTKSPAKNKRQAPYNKTTVLQQENNSLKVTKKLGEMQERSNKGENLTRTYIDCMPAKCDSLLQTSSLTSVPPIIIYRILL